MERAGEYLALWSNARNPWFTRNVLAGVDLVQEPLKQDPEVVRKALAALPAKRWRLRLPVRAKDRAGLLAEFAGLMESGAPADGFTSTLLVIQPTTEDPRGWSRSAMDGHWPGGRMVNS